MKKSSPCDCRKLHFGGWVVDLFTPAPAPIKSFAEDEVYQAKWRKTMELQKAREEREAKEAANASAAQDKEVDSKKAQAEQK